MENTVEVKSLSEAELKAKGFDLLNLMDVIKRDLSTISKELNRRLTASTDVKTPNNITEIAV